MQDTELAPNPEPLTVAFCLAEEVGRPDETADARAILAWIKRRIEVVEQFEALAPVYQAGECDAEAYEFALRVCRTSGFAAVFAEMFVRCSGLDQPG